MRSEWTERHENGSGDQWPGISRYQYIVRQARYPEKEAIAVSDGGRDCLTSRHGSSSWTEAQPTRVECTIRESELTGTVSSHVIKQTIRDTRRRLVAHAVSLSLSLSLIIFLSRSSSSRCCQNGPLADILVGHRTLPVRPPPPPILSCPRFSRWRMSARTSQPAALISSSRDSTRLVCRVCSASRTRGPQSS